MHLRHITATNQKASSENCKVSFEDMEGFFRRPLGSYTHKFPKRGAASLTDLPELHLCLPSCVCNRKAEQQRKGFRKHLLFFKTPIVYKEIEIFFAKL